MSNKTTYKCWVKVNATKTITLHTPDLLDFQNYQTSGGLFKTQVIKDNGKFKENIKSKFTDY